MVCRAHNVITTKYSVPSTIVTQMTHLHTIIPLHTSASTNTRDPVSAAVQIATHTGSPSSDSAAHWKRGICPQTHYGNATFVKEGMSSCYRAYTSTKEGQNMYTAERLPCQACPQLCSAAFSHCNTLKPTHQYLLLSQKGPSSKHLFITLDSAAQLGLGGLQ